MMPDAIILTQFEPLASSPIRLVARDHRGKHVVFLAGDTQRINILALQQQHLPCILLVDDLRTRNDERHVPAQAMVTVVPFSAAQVQSALDLGAADALLRACLNR